MVTKEKYYHQPTMSNFCETLATLKDKCVELDVKSVSMPRIGCGLDRLDWNAVKDAIESAFTHVDIDINVYYL